MLTAYIEATMRHARYEQLEDAGSYYAEIPDLRGVWANGPTRKAVEHELREVLEDWILVGIAHHAEIPVIDGISLAVTRPVSCLRSVRSRNVT